MPIRLVFQLSTYQKAIQNMHLTRVMVFVALTAAYRALAFPQYCPVMLCVTT
jgi:hypothetical protein